METVGPPPVEDDDLHLLYEWRDPFASGRRRTASVGTVVVHGAVIALLLFLPAGFLAPNPEPPSPEKKVIVTPLVEPLTEFTQKEPTKAKINREIDMASLMPRERIQAPQGTPSTPPPAAPRQAMIPAPPAPKPAAPMALPEPPKIEATNREAPKIDLPIPVPPPTVERPKLALENVSSPPPPPPPAQSKVPLPATSTAELLRQSARGTPGGGLVIGDPGAGPGGVGEGINLPPAPGAKGSALELKSDAQGVDFRPYLSQILFTIRRNWDAVYPESARMGRRGRVGLVFVITKVGKVDKITWAYQSGAEALDRAAVAAISASNPFPPLPPEFKGDRVILQLNFAYNMPKQ